MLRISQPKIQWQSWPPSADILPCKHIVLSYFAVTAFVANTADIRRPFNLAVLGRTDESTSDTTIRRNREHASKTCSFRYPQHHRYHLISREGARTVVHRFSQNRCQARCAPNKAPRGILRLKIQCFTIQQTPARAWMARAKPACRHFHYPFATISITPL